MSWPAVVHLIGRPGAGKLTVATAFVAAAAEAGRTVALLDNHRTSDPVLAMIGIDGRSAVPQAAWDRVHEVREVVYRAIEELGPPRWSYVLTNVLLDDDPDDHAQVARVRRMAELRDSRYVPVLVHCEEDELLRRVPDPGRAAKLKWIDPEGVRGSLARPLLVPSDAVELDTTHRSPEESARWLVERVEER